MQKKLGVNAPPADDRTWLEKTLNTPNKTGFLGDTLDLLSRFNYASANAVKTGMEGGNPLEGAWKGLSGQQRTTYSDVLDKAGVKNKYAKGIGGFAGDVLLDPTTYIGVGAAKSIGKTGIKGATALGKEVLPEGAKIARGLGNVGLKGAVKKVEEKAPLALKFAGQDLFKLKDLPGAGKVTNGLNILHDTAPVQKLGKAFVPFFRPAGWDKKGWDSFSRMARGYGNKLQFTREDAINNVVNLTKDLMPEQRTQILHALEKPELMSQLPPELAPKAQAFQDLFKQGADKELQLGLIKSTRENYVPHLRTEQTRNQGILGMFKQPLRAKDKFGKQRTLEGTVQDINQKAGKNIFETDIARVAGTREASRAGAVTTQEFVNNVLGKYGKKLSEGDRIAPDHVIYQPKGMFSKEQYAIPKDVGDYLNNFQRMFITDEGTKGMLGAYDKAMHLWKGYATAVNPGFHVRNGLSNFFQNWLGGVKNPQTYVDAQKVMKGGQDVLKGTKYTYDNVLKMAKEKGILGHGWIGSDIPNYVSEQLGEKLPGTAGDKLKQNLNLLSPSNKLMKTGRKAGESIENNARMAHFIDRLAKGDTPENASMSVKKFLFDYNELTPFERNVMKRAVPFYTWIRKNLPLQVEQLMKQPGKYAGINKAKNNIEQFSPKPDETYLPEYIKEGLGTRTPFGKPGEPLYYLPNLPFADVKKLDPTQAFQNAFSMLTPAAKVPLELGMNKNVFFDSPIEQYPGQLGKSQALGYVPGLGSLLGAKDVTKNGQTTKLMPAKTRYILEQLISPFGVNVSKGAENLAQGDKYGAGLRALSFLGGQKLSAYDKEKQKYYADKDQLQQLQDLLKKLRYDGTIQDTKKKKKAGGL